MVDEGSAPPPPRKKTEAPVEEGLPLWMATFADMVTLLLCFFVLLLSFANHDIVKFKTLMGSVKEAFGIQLKRQEAEYVAFSPSQYERKEVELDRKNKDVLGMVLQLKALVFEDEELKKMAKVSSEELGAVMRIPIGRVFTKGGAKLAPESVRVLDKVITLMKENNYNLVVRGHTDDQFQATDTFPSAWELTSIQAATTLRYLVEQGGISATRLKAVGYGDSQPLVPNNSPVNRYLNRRIEFYFHRPSDQAW